MGKRGPKDKPTNLKILQGNPGKRNLNENEPKFDVAEEVPNAPPFLSRYAKTEWKRIAPILHKNGLLTEADIASLAAYCQNYHRWIESEKLIRALGYTYETDKGNVIQRPEVGIANTAMKLMKQFAAEFGLTPSSRTNITADKTLESEDPFVNFIKGRK